MTMLKARNLTKQFGDFTALNGVDMDLGHGEVYGFIGPNGAGKSTTIRILLGMLKATSGEAQIFGKDVWKHAVDIHRKIAYVPGDVNLWPNLTGGEVIDLFMKMRGSIQHDKREKLIELFKFDPSKKCRTYSKGNRQKVALIAAFASNADLFILDEPTSGLDPLMERIFQQCVLDVKEQGKTVLLSSHILSEVERLCDRVAIIREGKIIEKGTLHELRHLTRSHFSIETKEFVPTIRELSGVHQVQENGKEYDFQVDTEAIDTVIRHLSKFGIIRLESAAPTLEDLFMRHYQGTGNEPAKVGGAV